jgi:hypothetical protein
VSLPHSQNLRTTPATWVGKKGPFTVPLEGEDQCEFWALENLQDRTRDGPYSTLTGLLTASARGDEQAAGCVRGTIRHGGHKWL